MNRHMATGRLTADPELRYSQNSRPIATFRLAIDRQIKREGQPSADYFNYVAFDKRAEFVSKYLRKGTKILVESRPQNNDYTKEDGTKVYGIEFYVDNIEFAESRAERPAEPQNTDFTPPEFTEAAGEDGLPF